MEASQLFLAHSPRTGSQALAEGASTKTISKSSDNDSPAFLDMIKAGLSAQLEQTSASSARSNQTAETTGFEANSELETATQESDSESMTELVSALNVETDLDLSVSQTPVPTPVLQTSPLLESLFIRQNLEPAELNLNPPNAVQIEASIWSGQNLQPSNPVLAEIASDQLSQEAFAAREAQATLTPSSSSEQARGLSFAQENPSVQEQIGAQIKATESLEQSAPLKKDALAALNLKIETGSAEQTIVSQPATPPVKQGQVAHFDYWQNLFQTLTQAESVAPDVRPTEALAQTSVSSAPPVFSWLLSNLGVRLQAVNQSDLTWPAALQNQMLNLPGLKLPIGMTSSQASVSAHSLTSDLQLQTSVASSDIFNLSLETHDFTQQQENNGFWPRANEITAATQPTRTDTRAEWMQASAEKVIHELGERFAIVKQLTQRMQFLNQRDRSLELSLEPAHLGKLTMRLQQSAQQLSLQVFTEMPLAKDLIESHLQQLRNQLQAQGYDVQQIHVHLQSEQQFSQHSSSGQEQEFDQASSSGHFDLFQSEDIFAEPELESDTVQAEPKSNYQINTLV